MGMENYSLSDVAAVTGNEGFGSGNGSWMIIILLFLFMGGNGFGGNAGVGNVSAIDSSYSRGYEAAKGIADGQMTTYNTSMETQKEILENRYASALEFQRLSAQQAQCCCETKSAIHAEGEATRALITGNRIHELESLLAGANNQISNLAQTQTILNQLAPRVPYDTLGFNGGYPIAGVTPFGTAPLSTFDSVVLKKTT